MVRSILIRKGNGTLIRIIDGEKKNIVGGNVRKFRIARGMSQQQVADRLELLAIYICRGSISRVEDRTRTVTDIELYGFAQIFKVSVQELMETDDYP